MRRIFAFLLVVAGAWAPATNALAQSSGSDQPSIGIRLLQAPLNLVHDPRARVYIIDHVAPGTTFSRQVGVTNTGSTSVQVQLYGGAAVVEGGSFVGEPRTQNNDLATWISVSPGVLTVPARGEATATVTIAVPGNAEPGERYGVVWAQPPAQTSSSGVAEVNRVGIRVYLSVGSGAAPPINFTINSLTAARDRAGVPFVTALVHNTGGRAVDLSGTLELSNGPAGTRAGPFPAKLGTTLGIGQTEPVTVPLARDVPLGPWTATISLTSDEVTRAATGLITFPANAGTSAAPVLAKAVQRRGTVFWVSALIAALAIGVVLLFLWLIWRRRDQDDDEAPGDRRSLSRSST